LSESSHPLAAQGYRFVFHTPKYRHGSHTMPVDVDMIAMLFGLARPAATEFSFLVGVPTLLAAGALETYQALRHPAGPPADWGLLALGTVVSAVTAFVVVRWLLRWVQTHSFAPFGWYRIVLGLVMLAGVV